MKNLSKRVDNKGYRDPSAYVPYQSPYPCVDLKLLFTLQTLTIKLKTLSAFQIILLLQPNDQAQALNNL